MAWDAGNPTNDELLINFPAQCRANWDALELGTDANLLITNAKCHASMGLVDSKLAQITTASKVHGTAITGLASLPAGAGLIPVANIPNLSTDKLTSGTLPLTRGGTGSVTQNFVDLTTGQVIAGAKTFSTFPITPSSAPTSDYQASNKKYVDDQVAAITTSPSGAIAMWGGALASPPSDWLACDGSAVSRTTYAVLYGIVGTTFGVGDGSTTFNLPDFTNVFPYGASEGASDGNASVGSKYAGFKIRGNDNTVTNNSDTINMAPAGSTNGATVKAYMMPPYLAVGFIIKT